MPVRPARWLAAALLGALAAAGPARGADVPAGREVKEVVVKDLASVDAEYVRGVMHTRAGLKYDDNTVNGDVQRLHNTHRFIPNSVKVDTAIEADGRVTVFVKAVAITGTAREVVYRGAQHYSDSELADLTNLRPGTPMNPSVNQAAKQAILNKLWEDGRAYANVELTEGGRISDERIVFTVVEGPAVRVRSIRFAGNREASSGRLATQVVTSSALIPNVVTVLTAKFNRLSLEEDRKKLTQYYHRMGFLDMTVRPDIVPVHGGAAVDIVYHISEGRPYTINTVTIEGSKTVPAEELKRVTAVKAGEVYNVDVITADEKRIETRCGNGGHQTAVQHEKFAVPGQAGMVNVVYRVEQRNAEPDRVGRIIIRGNTTTQDRVILNELGPNLLPGQILRYPYLEAARQNLIRRNLFDQDNPPRVEVAPNQFDTNVKDIIVTVQEARTGMAALQANINSDAGINGSLVLNQRNFDITRVPTSFDDLLTGKAFTGAGQELRLEAMPGTTFQRYAATFREPYLFDSRFGLTTSIYYFTRDYLEYDEQRVGIRNTIDYRLDNPNWRINGAVRLEDVKVSGVAAYEPKSILNDLGHSTVLGLRAGLTRDTRDSYLLPSKGSVIDVGFEQVLGDYTFPIGTFEVSKYDTLWQRKDGSGKHVFSNRSQLTIMGDNAPVFERIYAGGIRSFRGFNFRGVGPFDPATRLNTGGTFAWLNTHEYQVPITAADKLWLAAFIDHGTVESDAAIRNYRVAIGAGLRISVPALGPMPIALDFAVPLRKGPYDNKQLFSFYMGWGVGS